MGTFKRYGIFAAAYAFAGIAILITHYMMASPYNKAALDEKINLVAASHFHLSQLVDNLPAVFRENPHAAALKVSDLRGNFLGAMYDARRMNGLEYKKFLEAKTFDTTAASVSGFMLHVWESKRRKLRIITLSLPRAQLSEYFALMGRDYSLHYIIPLYILLGGLIIAGWHFFTNGKLPLLIPKLNGKKTTSSNTPSFNSPIAPARPVVMPKPPKHAWQLKTGVLAESTMQAALEKLSRLSGASRISLYAQNAAGFLKKNTIWQGVIEIRGQGSLTIRGEGMAPNTMLANNATDFTEICPSPDRKTWLFFNAAPAEAQTCFAFFFENAEAAPTTERQAEIAAMVKAMSRSLLVEHYYENSIIDAESGLYSAPYASFSLKEKILAGQPFATAAFRFTETGVSGAALGKIARTAIRVLRENFPAEEAPIVARAELQTILIIFHADSRIASAAEKAVRDLCAAYVNSGTRPHAAFIADTAGCGAAGRALKILDRLIAKSAAGTLEVYKVQHPLNII